MCRARSNDSRCSADKIRQLPDAVARVLPRTSKLAGRLAAHRFEEDALHPIIGQALAAEKVRDWRAQAERGRQAKIGRRGWFNRPVAGSTPPMAVAESAGGHAAEATVPASAMRRPVIEAGRNDRQAA